MKRSSLRILTCAVVAAALVSAGPAPAAAISPQLARVVIASGLVTEGESLAGRVSATSGSAGVQQMASFGPGWSGNAQLFWGAGGSGAELRFQINVASAGRYRMDWTYTQAPDFGKVAVFVDNKQIGSWNGYGQNVAPATAQMGPVDLAAGPRNVVLRVSGKDDRSTNYFVGLDRIQLVPEKQEAASSTGKRLSKPTSQNAQSKRLQLPSRRRLQRALERDPQGDALLAAALHTIERGLSLPANQRTSDFDRMFNEVLQRHPNVPKQLLGQLASDYRALPRAVRTRGVPANIADVPVTQPLNTSVVNMAIGNSVPAAPKGYDPGQTITLVGRLFSSNKSENTVIVLKEMAGGSKAEVTGLTPSVARAEALEIKIPGSLAPGHYYLQVNVKRPDKVAKSNLADLYIKSPPPPAPVIKSISPKPQFPGRQVLINGQNLKGTSSIAGVWFKPMENQPLASFVTLKGEKVGFGLGKALNATQIEVTIPSLLMAGKYRVVTEVPGAGMSQWFEYEVRPFRYQVNFTSIKCKDESDPEWAGGDELVVAWVVVGDSTAYAKSTGDHNNYKNFDDGDTDTFHPADRAVFMPAGGPDQVKRALAINTTLYEWDAGDVKAVNEVIGFVGDLAAKILTSTGQVEWAVVVKILTPIVQKVVSWVGGNPDHLGDRNLAWSAVELIEDTDNPEGRFTGHLDFDNSDDDGSYRLYYEVVRIAE